MPPRMAVPPPSHEARDGASIAMRRREALVAAGGAGLALIWTASRGWVSLADAATDPAASLAAACTLSKELTEGPYWIDNDLTRRNIKAGKARRAARAAYSRCATPRPAR